MSLHHRRMRVTRSLDRAMSEGRLAYWMHTGTGWHVSIGGGQTRTFDLKGVEAYCDGLDTRPATGPTHTA